MQYMAPELYRLAVRQQRDDSLRPPANDSQVEEQLVFPNAVRFDGLAADMWSCGVVLFGLLASRVVLWKCPHRDDATFKAAYHGCSLQSKALLDQVPQLQSLSQETLAVGFRLIQLHPFTRLHSSQLLQSIGPAWIDAKDPSQVNVCGITSLDVNTLPCNSRQVSPSCIVEPPEPEAKRARTDPSTQANEAEDPLSPL